MTLQEAIQRVKAAQAHLRQDLGLEAFESAHAALVELSTKVHYSPRDRTGQSSTRAVQGIARKALEGPTK